MLNKTNNPPLYKQLHFFDSEKPERNLGIMQRLVSAANQDLIIQSNHARHRLGIVLNFLQTSEGVMDIVASEIFLMQAAS